MALLLFILLNAFFYMYSFVNQCIWVTEVIYGKALLQLGIFLFYLLQISHHKSAGNDNDSRAV